jgi:hypothetical protein
MTGAIVLLMFLFVLGIGISTILYVVDILCVSILYCTYSLLYVLIIIDRKITSREAILNMCVDRRPYRYI